MAARLSTEDLPLLPTMSAETPTRKLALIVVLISSAVFLAIAPFAKLQLAPVAAFIPIYESALLLNDVITAVMLFGHFSILRTRALLMLGCGYLFTAAITIPHALTFPGVFAPGGLLGAGTQSTAWLYAFWHAGFPLCVIGYALLNARERSGPRLIARPGAAIALGIAAVLAAAGAFTWLATAWHALLPPLLLAGHYTPTGTIVFTSTWVFSLVALAVMWRCKGRTLLDVWLMVVLCAWLFDIALSAVLNNGRFDLGFYAGRIYGLLAASCVLVMLLLENNKLYARLVVAHDTSLRRAAGLQGLNAQNEERAAQYAHALEELHYKEEEIRAVVQNISDCVITIDSSGAIRSANPAIEHIFGYPPADAIGASILTLIPRLYLHAPTGGDVEGRHKDGTSIALELTLNDFVVHGERLLIGTMRDIGERTQLINELKLARAYAEQANLAKSAFLANMSHELRTPLNAILGFSQILVSETLPLSAEKRLEFSAHILKAGKHLLALINEVLDLAKVESGTLALSLEAVQLPEVMLACEQMIKPIADQRDIRVMFAMEGTLTVLADRVRLQQVLLNLLSNAVKYNRPGGAIIAACIAPEPGMIRITVQDNGHGLSEDQLAQLFQPFNRLGQETGAEEGSGIGLVVTKRLVELMGGSIGVNSSVGSGSTFSIDLKAALPVQRAEGASIPEQQRAAPAWSGAAARTLLYVEDNPANLVLVQEIIAFRSDLRVITAPDARLGIAMARAHLPAVILMDINLPGMSGNEAMAILRADPAMAAIPVIALSANAMPQDIARSMAQGFSRYLTKPINVDEFFAALDGALVPPAGEAPAAHTA